MEKNKGILLPVFLVIAIVLIIVMGAVLYMQKTKSDRQIAKLENNISELQENIDDLQEKINSIPNTDNSNNNKQTEENLIVTMENRDQAIQELKKALTNKAWINENLYLKENIFGEKILESEEQYISFEVIDNENEKAPIIVVQTEVKNSKQVSIIRYKNDEVNVKKWTTQNGSRTTYEIKDNILIECWMAMGDWSYEVYTVDEMSEEQIEAHEGSLVNEEDYTELEKITEKYSTKQISKELNDTNVDRYIK